LLFSDFSFSAAASPRLRVPGPVVCSRDGQSKVAGFVRICGDLRSKGAVHKILFLIFRQITEAQKIVHMTYFPNFCSTDADRASRFGRSCVPALFLFPFFRYFILGAADK
jgi:hypothetical protein